jgi:hypothetical protein
MNALLEKPETVVPTEDEAYLGQKSGRSSGR